MLYDIAVIGAAIVFVGAAIIVIVKCDRPERWYRNIGKGRP